MIHVQLIYIEKYTSILTDCTPRIHAKWHLLNVFTKRWFFGHADAAQEGQKDFDSVDQRRKSEWGPFGN
ncbi:hypothetical protein ALT721_400004 [Alteromonas alvinellae]